MSVAAPPMSCDATANASARMASLFLLPRRGLKSNSEIVIEIKIQSRGHQGKTDLEFFVLAQRSSKHKEEEIVEPQRTNDK